MNKALYLLIGFASGVLLFDLFIRLLELLLIAMPLAGLADVVALMTEYSLDEAQGRADEVEQRGCCVEIAEVGKLRQGLVFALESLRDYKAYLPQTLFDASENEPTDTGNSSKSSPTASRSKRSTSSISLSAAAAAPLAKRTDRTLQQVKGVLMTCRLFDVEEKGKLVPDAVQGAVAALQSACTAHRAVLHLWSAAAANTVFVSLNMSSRCSDTTARAADLAWEIRSCMSAACAFVARPFQHGNLGTATLRGYTIHAAGSPLMQLLEYATYVHHMAMPVVLTDPRTAESLFGRTLPVGKVLYKGASDNQQTVLAHHILKNKTVEAQEWMYEMEEKKDLLAQAMLALCTDGVVPDDVLRAVEKRPAKNTLEEKLQVLLARCRPPVFDMTFTGPWGVHGE